MRMLIPLALVLAFAGGITAYAFLRPNRASVAPELGLETWDIVRDGLHNSNTDMVHWRGAFFLVHAASPFHLGSPQCRLVVRRSQDARVWEPVAELRVEGEDIRDPKFVVIGDELFLYALPNRGRMATPYETVVARSKDGVRWSEFASVGHPGWLFWRPKTPDGETWYVGAYWHDHGRSALLSSRDGLAWTMESVFHEGEGNDETAVEPMADGRLLATARLEVTPDTLLGNNDAGTLIATARPPFTDWRTARSSVTRLDGPALFSHDGRIYAVARYQPGPRGWLTALGGVLSRKRTSLFLVEEDRLVYLSDFPSAGDTSYAGVVTHGGFLYASYYTSDIYADYPWLLGMFLASDIRMAKVPLDALAALAERRR